MKCEDLLRLPDSGIDRSLPVPSVPIVDQPICSTSDVPMSLNYQPMLDAPDHRRLISYVSRFVGFNDAEDVVQETYIKAYLYRDLFDDRCKWRTWIFAIARNAALDSRRRSSHRPLGHATELGSLDFELPIESRLLRFELLSQLRLLPIDDARVILMYLRLGSYKKTALELGWTSGKFKARMYRIRERLRGVSQEAHPCPHPTTGVVSQQPVEEDEPLDIISQLLLDLHKQEEQQPCIA